MTRYRIAAALVLAMAFGGCSDPVDTTPNREDGLAFAFGGVDYRAAGSPSFSGQNVEAATFAVAFHDSVGGLVITSFQLKEGSRGDLFILQLTSSEVGTFTCGVGHDCHGRLLEGIDAANLQDVEEAWEIDSGSVTVENLGDDEIAGRFDDLLLLPGSGGTVRSVESGTFDLPLLSQTEGVEIMNCFLARTTGGSCD